MITALPLNYYQTNMDIKICWQDTKNVKNWNYVRRCVHVLHDHKMFSGICTPLVPAQSHSQLNATDGAAAARTGNFCILFVFM